MTGDRSDGGRAGLPRRLLALACLGCGALLACLLAGSLAAWLALREPGPARATLTPRGGRVELGAVAIVAPEGAVASETPLSATQVPAPGSPDANLVLVSPAFRVESGGRLFEKPLTVELPYDKASLPEGASPIPLLWTGRGYLTLEGTVDAARARVVFETTHFSDHAVGYSKSPGKTASKSDRYPFDVVVVDSVRARMRPELPAELERAISFGYARLTEPTWNYLFYAPPHGKGKRLKVEVTDLTALASATAGGAEPYANTVSDELIQVSPTLPSEERTRAVAVHELFHAVQWAYYRRACEKRGKALSVETHANVAWLDEATATWAAHKLLPDLPETSELATPRLCYQPLLFHAGEAKRHHQEVEAGAERHEYASALFVQYLASRLGAKVVNDLLLEAFARDETQDTERVVEAVLERASGKKKDALWGFTTDFVLAREWSKTFGWDAKAWQMGTPGKVETFSDRTLELTVKPKGPASVAIPGGTESYLVPRAVRVRLPEGAEGSLVLTLSGGTEGKGERWFHAFAAPATGSHRHLGGAETTLRSPVEKGDVIVLPVAHYGDALSLEAKLEPGPPPSGLELHWTPDPSSYDDIIAVHVSLWAHDPAKALAALGGPATWARLEIAVNGEKRYVYGRLGDLKEWAYTFYDGIRVVLPGPLELTATVRVGGETLTATKTMTRDLSHKPQLDSERASLEGRLASETETSTIASDRMRLASGWRQLGEADRARAEWEKVLALDTLHSVKRDAHWNLARLALDAGDLDGYESHVKAENDENASDGGTARVAPDLAEMARSAVRVHDDLEKAWELDARRSAEERKRDPLVLPGRGDRVEK